MEKNKITQKSTITLGTLQLLKDLKSSGWESEYNKLFKDGKDGKSKITKRLEKNEKMFMIMRLFDSKNGQSIPANENKIYNKLIKNIDDYDFDINIEEATEEEKQLMFKIFEKDIKEKGKAISATDNVIEYNKLLGFKSQLLNNILFHIEQENINIGAINQSTEELQIIIDKLSAITLSEEELIQSNSMIELQDRAMNSDHYIKFMLNRHMGLKRYKIEPTK